MRRADHTTISVCVPALDEEATIAGVVAPFVERLSRGEVDRVVVADSGSSDATAERAVAAGAEVVDVRDAAPGPVQGKGDTIRRVLPALDGELLVFVDGDLENVHGGYVTALTAPLLERPEVQLVKGTFERPLNRPGGAAFGGGRVTELLAKPLLEALYPELALWPGYGLEIGVLLDTYKRAGRDAIAEADLGILLNAHQEITALNGMAKEVLAVVLHHLAREDRFHGDAGAAAPLAPLQVGLCR